MPASRIRAPRLHPAAAARGLGAGVTGYAGDHDNLEHQVCRHEERRDSSPARADARRASPPEERVGAPRVVVAMVLAAR